MATETNTPASSPTFTATTNAGTFRAWLTGAESWDDDGTERWTNAWIMEEPNGTTYGYFTPQEIGADHKAFYGRVWSND